MDEVYQRQEGLNILKKYRHAVVVGVGGGGSWTAMILAMAGAVKKLTLIDHDVIEIHNLNRTPYRLSDVGKLKVEALKELILERREDIEIETIPDRCEPHLLSIIHRRDKIDIVFCCADDVNARKEIKQWCVDNNVEFRSGGYDGMSISVVNAPEKVIDLGEGDGGNYIVGSHVVTAMTSALVMLFNSKEKNATVDVKKVLKVM